MCKCHGRVLLPDLPLFFLRLLVAKNPPLSSMGGSNPGLFRPLVNPAGRPILLCPRAEDEFAEDGILDDPRKVTLTCDCGSWDVDLTSLGRSGLALQGRG